MKRSLAVLATLGLMAGASALGAVPAGAGAATSYTVNVTKAVTGDYPTTGGYVIQVSCTGPNGGAPVVTDLAYDYMGGTQNVRADFDYVCTVTETVDNGADTTTYGCALAVGSSAVCDSDNQVSWPDDFGGEATVTVTNDFDPVPTTTTTTSTTSTTTTTTTSTTAPAPSPAAQPVAAAPAFTG